MSILQMVFLKILDMSLTASYVILAVLLARLLLKRAPKSFSYALWSVAAFRLVCPVSFASMVSIFNIGALLVPQSGGSAIQTPANTSNIVTAPQIALPPALTNSRQMVTAAETQSADPMHSLLTAAVVLWCAGIAVMLVYSMISYIKVKRAVSNAVRLEGNVFECDGIQSPFVLGVLKPKIYIPFRMKESERACILCHERHHIRRLDHVIKPLAFLILTVYWFHPLVWLAYLLMCKDMEMSCDEKVLSILGTTAKKDYSLSLLSVGTRRHFPAASPLFFGETGVKTRVRNVLGFQKPKAWAMTIAVLLCVVLAAACAADANEPKTTDITPNNDPIVSEGTSQPEDSADAFGHIFGRYEFEENVYTNPLSSFYAMKGYMPHFDISDNGLRIVNQEYDTAEEYTGALEPIDISKEDFEALFENEIVLEGTFPDISVYEQCRQYAVYKDEYDRVKYRLYLMDDEVWLMKMANSHLWSIYQLVKSGDISESTVGGADGPQNVQSISESTLDGEENTETGSRDEAVHYPAPGTDNNHSGYTEKEYEALMDLKTDDYRELSVSEFDTKAKSIQMIYNGYNPNDENVDFMKTLLYSTTELVYAENQETPIISISTAANKKTDMNEYYGAKLNYAIKWKIANKDITTVGERDDVLNTCQNSVQSLLESKNRDGLQKNNIVALLQTECDALAEKLSSQSISIEIVIESLSPVSE